MTRLRARAAPKAADTRPRVKTKSMSHGTPVARRILRVGYRSLVAVIPENRFGDRLFAFVNFAVRHRRLPTDDLNFNDVLYKIKTSDEILNPLRVFVSDKEFLKIYVKAIAGDRYNVPTIDVIRNAEVAESYNFPADCCIKPTHASGKVILRRSHEPIDRAEIRSWFSLNYYRNGREANYKTLRPKVIIEPLVFDNADIEDYRFFCLDGDVKLIFMDIGKYTDYTRLVLDPDWNPKDFSIGYPRSRTVPERPGNLEEMLAVARRLSSGFGFVRVDMYSNGKTCYVGEISNCHARASQRFIPLTGEREASELIFG
jgi:hypothetical protein